MHFPFKLAPDKDFDVVGFGTNAVDYLIVVPEYPGFNTKIKLTDYIQAAGGEVATTMAGLSRLGMKTAYAGRFGTDPEGEIGFRSLSGDGVDLEYAERVEGARTQIAFILIDERNGERTVIWHRDTKLAYSAEEAPLEAVRRGRILHFTPHDTKACRVLAGEAKRYGSLVSIDVDNLFDGIEDVLPLVDVLITSAEFPEKLVGIADREQALRTMRSKYGCPVVGMTLGETGSLLLCGDGFIRTPGFGVPGGCKDTTGAGDAFRVGLLYGILKGETVEQTARMANAVAALKCRAIGARTSLPTEPELADILG